MEKNPKNLIMMMKTKISSKRKRENKNKKQLTKFFEKTNEYRFVLLHIYYSDDIFMSFQDGRY